MIGGVAAVSLVAGEVFPQRVGLILLGLLPFSLWALGIQVMAWTRSDPGTLPWRVGYVALDLVPLALLGGTGRVTERPEVAFGALVVLQFLVTLGLRFALRRSSGGARG